MRAVVIAQQDGASALELQDVPDPRFGPDELLVDVHASAVNRADLRRAPTHFGGSEQVADAAIGGLEMAGTVAAVGEHVRGFTVGDRVMAMTGRSWAERVAVDHRLALPVPNSFGWAEAAATPISFITAHDALVAAANLQPGETVLIRGASSAAGLASVQMARVLGAASVFATTNSAAKLPLLTELGAQALDSSLGPIAPAIQRLTNDLGAGVVIDIVAGDTVPDTIDATAIAGRIVCLGRLGGTDVAFNIDEFSRKRIRLIGVTFRTRTLEERFAVVARFRDHALPLLESGDIRPVIDRRFTLDQTADAEQYVRDNHNFGKVVIEITD